MDAADEASDDKAVSRSHTRRQYAYTAASQWLSISSALSATRHGLGQTWVIQCTAKGAPSAPHSALTSARPMGSLVTSRPGEPLKYVLSRPCSVQSMRLPKREPCAWRPSARSSWKTVVDGVRRRTPALKCAWYLGASAAKVVTVEKVSETGPVRTVSASR